MQKILTRYVLPLCMLFLSEHILAQTILKGRVTDADTGEPLVGATVNVVGKNVNATTDESGYYTINDPVFPLTLQVTYVGFQSNMINVDRNRTVDVSLNQDASSLDEVVVVGYGTQRKETVTGSISSIKTKELVQSPVANISNSLAGRLPGLTAIQRSGEPGLDASSIKIRGIGSLSTGSESDPLILIDGVPRDNMNQLDPNEIENLTILKDASATAVYGVRGANGVILITTKSGKLGAPTVSVSSNVGVQMPSSLPDFLDSYNYALLKNEAYMNDGQPAPFSKEQLEKFRTNSDPIVYPNNDWMDLLIKEYSLQQQYNLNVTGGFERVKYFVSAGYFDQPGSFNTGGFDYGFDPNPTYKRYNFRSNIDVDFTDRLSGSVKVGTQYGMRNFHPTAASSMFFNILNTAPYSGPGIVDGKLVDGYINDPLGGMAIESRGYSLFRDVLDNGYRTESINDINLNFALKYDLSFLIEGLSVRAMYAYDNKYTRIVNRNKEVDVYSILVHEDGSTSLIQKSDEGSFTYQFGGAEGYRKNYFESSLNYSELFGNHHVTGLLLYNQSKEYDKSYQYGVPRTILGLAGRMTYSYMDRYLAEFNAGYNGSENFPDNKRFGFFPAYSLGWVASNESFFPKQSLVSYLKFRGSYGEVGNDKIGGDRFLYLPSTYTYLTGGTNGYYFGEYGVNKNKYNGSRENKIGNPNVTWERAIKANVGLEIGLLDKRLYVTTDYFQENRDNILVNLGTVPDLVAATLPAANIGKVENKGFEFEMSWQSRSDKDFSYRLSANIAYSKNKILFRDEPTPLYPWMGQTGYTIGQIKGYVSNGFYNTEDELSIRPYYTFAGNDVERGDLKFVDIDGDGKIDQNDAVPIGYNNVLPEFTGGLSANFAYKGVDLSILINGMANYSGMFTDILGWAFDWNNRQTLSKFADRWSEERYESGAVIRYPRLSIFGNQSPSAQRSDFLIQNMSHLRLKNVEFGYTFRQDFVKRIHINSLRVYVNGNNLFYVSNLKDFDPDSQDGSRLLYPQMRVVNVGVNLQF